MGSCRRSGGLDDNAVRFDSVETDETYHLFNDTAQPRCNVQIRYQYPDSADACLLQTLRNQFIDKVFGETFENTPPAQILEEYKRQYINDFKRFEGPDGLKSLVGGADHPYIDSNGYVFRIQLKDSVLYNKNGFISFLVETTDYAGGVHRSHCAYAYVIQLSTGDFLREEDFAGLHYKKNLSLLIVQKLAVANDLDDPEELENLGYIALSDIVPNGNFSIDDKGITYYFNENEIAGIGEGVIRVFISYDEIELYLAAESPLEPFFQ
jgi:hypothetical protein